ncbi:MAG: hypothetical protein QOH62_3146 [Solirubrobacteraceae bacterium]|nr:hypothetical protein [Solirubrobacteraceae bacterium]
MTSPVERFGGTEGNEVLTSAVAAILTLLLIGEGVTIIDMGGLRTEHMFIGMLLIPPVLVKLGSTGYRFARYYLGARAYRQKGPPLLPLRLLAPVLVVMTLAVFVSGIVLLIDGRKSDLVLEIHKVTFIVWGVVFAVHFLAYIPRMLRSLGSDWTVTSRRKLPGSGLRLGLLIASVASGAALALLVLSPIRGWHG